MVSIFLVLRNGNSRPTFYRLMSLLVRVLGYLLTIRFFLYLAISAPLMNPVYSHMLFTYEFFVTCLGSESNYLGLLLV